MGLLCTTVFLIFIAKTNGQGFSFVNPTFTNPGRGIPGLPAIPLGGGLPLPDTSLATAIRIDPTQVDNSDGFIPGSVADPNQPAALSTVTFREQTKQRKIEERKRAKQERDAARLEKKLQRINEVQRKKTMRLVERADKMLDKLKDTLPQTPEVQAAVTQLRSTLSKYRPIEQPPPSPLQGFQPVAQPLVDPQVLPSTADELPVNLDLSPLNPPLPVNEPRLVVKSDSQVQFVPLSVLREQRS